MNAGYGLLYLIFLTGISLKLLAYTWLSNDSDQ
jgi:hypothetical protein